MPGGESSEGSSGGKTSSGSGPSGASVIVSLDVGSVMSFDPKGDPHGISQSWKRWKRSCKLYLVGKE